MERKPRIAFVCTHNACRSQIAEALAKWYGNDVIVAYSAGTTIADEINPDAVQVMKDIYDVDLTADQFPKTLDDIPEVDIVISMGCGVECPVTDSQYYEDWEIEDPTGKDREAFEETVAILEEKIKYLIELIIRGRYPIEVSDAELDDDIELGSEQADEEEDILVEELEQED